MKQTWIVIVIAALVVVAIASVSTVLFIRFDGQSDSVDEISKRPRRFNLFDGFSLCEQAIRDSVGGKVIELESDDRAARYEFRDNINQLFFTMVYRPVTGVFGGKMGEETKVFVRCDVSAETNDVEAIRVRPGEEEDFTEVHRRR